VIAVTFAAIAMHRIGASRDKESVSTADMYSQTYRLLRFERAFSSSGCAAATSIMNFSSFGKKSRSAIPIDRREAW
jgi:hypothetical protein